MEILPLAFSRLNIHLSTRVPFLPSKIRINTVSFAMFANNHPCVVIHLSSLNCRSRFVFVDMSPLIHCGRYVVLDMLSSIGRPRYVVANLSFLRSTLFFIKK